LNGKGYNAAADRRHTRRELADGEIVALLRAAEGDGIVGGMAGPDRAVLYTLAVTTGLRAGELDAGELQPGRNPARRRRGSGAEQEAAARHATAAARGGGDPAPVA